MAIGSGHADLCPNGLWLVRSIILHNAQYSRRLVFHHDRCVAHSGGLFRLQRNPNHKTVYRHHLCRGCNSFDSLGKLLNQQPRISLGFCRAKKARRGTNKAVNATHVDDFIRSLSVYDDQLYDLSSLKAVSKCKGITSFDLAESSPSEISLSPKKTWIIDQESPKGLRTIIRVLPSSL